MFDVFGSVKSLLKFDKVRIDDDVSRLHYKATVILLFSFSLLITSRQYLGDPIDCIVDEIPHGVMDTYCWIYSTFTLPKKMTARVGKEVIHPGVGSFAEDEDKVKFHKYYQWVCFVLFFQAVLFYIPRYLWKMWEGNRMKNLVLELNSPFVEETAKKERKRIIIEFFQTNLNKQNVYVYKFFLCGVLNLANVIGQIFFLDVFLDGEFSTYGSDVVKFTGMDPQEREDPMSRVFPKVTKCTFRKFGSTGTVQNFDGLCVLPLNIINEKIFVFLWFWFIILSIVTVLYMFYIIALLAAPFLRGFLLRRRAGDHGDKDPISKINKEFSIGDWFILYQLGANMDPLIYKELISELSVQL